MACKWSTISYAKSDEKLQAQFRLHTIDTNDVITIVSVLHERSAVHDKNAAHK